MLYTLIMPKKFIIFAGIILIILISSFVIWKSTQTSIAPKSPGGLSTAKVISWNSGTNLLEVKINSQKNVFLLRPPQTQVYTSVIGPNKSRVEKRLMSTVGEWWYRAFCPGDQVEYQLSGTSKSGSITPLLVRNLGPQPCAPVSLPPPQSIVPIVK